MDALEAMSRELLVVPPDLRLHLAWRIMKQQRIRHLLVAQGQQLLGLLSERDVLLRATPGPHGEVQASADLVETAMVHDPPTCEPHVPISYVARMMTDLRVDAIPVVQGDELVGLVTSTDLLQLLTDRSTAEVLPFSFMLEQASEEDWLVDGGAGS
jgi:acetoin utilization protein AcuB